MSFLQRSGHWHMVGGAQRRHSGLLHRILLLSVWSKKLCHMTTRLLFAWPNQICLLFYLRIVRCHHSRRLCPTSQLLPQEPAVRHSAGDRNVLRRWYGSQQCCAFHSPLDSVGHCSDELCCGSFSSFDFTKCGPLTTFLGYCLKNSRINIIVPVWIPECMFSKHLEMKGIG